MGMMENRTQELGSNMVEKSKTLEDEDGNLNCKPSTLDNYKVDSETLVNVPVELKEATGGENVEKKLISVEESSNRSEEMRPNAADISQNLAADKRESISESAKLSSENLEALSKNALGSLEKTGVSPVTASVNPGNGELEEMAIGAGLDPGHVEAEDNESSARRSKRKAKLETPVSSTRVLRPKSQEKPKEPEPNDTAKTDSDNGEKKRRGRKKKPMNNNNVNEFSRIRSHLRYLLHRIKYEQSLIDAYSAEGWKGQSLEKLKPEKELERAKSHIISYKLKIRALFQHLDTTLSVGKIPASLFDSKGEIDSEDIFCAKCGSKDLSLDNDIILCDGACERGFHQFCLEPPLLKEHIPPGDEGWLCPGCDCKLNCLDILKDHQGTNISLLDSWEKIFPEAAAAASGKNLDAAAGPLSDDSEDDDYDPDKPDTIEKVEEDESSSDDSDYFSASDDLKGSVNNDKIYLGLNSDDSEDDDFDPSDADEDKDVKQDSSSSDFTSDSEDLDALLDDATVTGGDLGHILPSSEQEQPSSISKEENSKVGLRKRQTLKDELSYLVETGAEPVSDKRHVERLDYKKLNDETFGNSSSDSSDEDFDDDDDEEEEDSDDTTTRKRRKISSEKTKMMSPNRTPMTEIKRGMTPENQKESTQLPKRTRKNGAEKDVQSSAKVGSTGSGSKRSANKRLGEATTQRLYESFNQNQYPERAVKENLAKELGITFQQVSKWFENARWSFNHRPQMESKTPQKVPDPQPTIDTDKKSPNQNVGLQQSSAVVAQNNTSEARTENLVTITHVENSGTRKSRKRKGEIDQPPNNTSVTNETQSPHVQSRKRQTRSNAKSVA